MSRSTTAAATGVLSLCALLVLASCATPAADAPSVAAVSALPAASPSPHEQLVATRGAAEVQERDGVAVLCVGGLYTASLPGSCSGVPLIGWAWDDRSEAIADDWGQRFGYFEVTGLYDAREHTFTVHEAAPAEEPGELAPWPTVDFTTPCPEPDGGWRIVDEATTTEQALQAVISRAESLAGHSIAWLDRPPVPEELVRAAENGEPVALSDPRTTVVNVSRVGRLAETEATLREVWGGMLCVTPAMRTAAEYRAISEEVVAELGRNLLYGGRDSIHEWMEYTIVYDDGTLQSEYDQRYGPGVVRLESALIPVA